MAFVVRFTYTTSSFDAHVNQGKLLLLYLLIDDETKA